jgi:hypothetical protein
MTTAQPAGFSCTLRNSRTSARRARQRDAGRYSANRRCIPTHLPRTPCDVHPLSRHGQESQRRSRTCYIATKQSGRNGWARIKTI